MADSNGHLSQTIDYLRGIVREKVESVRRELVVINELEEKAGLAERTQISDLFSDLSVEPTGGRGKAGSLPMSHDTFLGLDPLTAAKEYMRRVRHAVHIDEIANAIEKGGAVVKAPDWKKSLENSLTRSVRDVLKVREGEPIFGMTDFYTADQLKRLRGSRRSAKYERNKRKGGRARSSKGTRRPKRKESDDKEQKLLPPGEE